MKYETPELTVLTSAISAVRSAGEKGEIYLHPDSMVGQPNEQFGAGYTDWE